MSKKESSREADWRGRQGQFMSRPWESGFNVKYDGNVLE